MEDKPTKPVNEADFLAEQVRYHLTSAVRELMLTRETIIAGLQQTNMRNDAMLDMFCNEITKLKGLWGLPTCVSRLEPKIDSLMRQLEQVSERLPAKPRRKPKKRKI